MAKKLKGNEISNKTLFIFILLLATRKFFKGITFITRFFPASLFFRDHLFHDENREAARIRDIIEEKWDLIPNIYDRDEYFYYYYCSRFKSNNGKPSLEGLRRWLDKKLGVGNFFLKKEGKLLRISVPR